MEEDVKARRERLQAELGFLCQCEGCLAQERACAANPSVFLEVAIGGARVGRIELTLRADVAPRTCENFRCLCTGERGADARGQPLHYKGTALHRIIPGLASPRALAKA